LSALIKSIIVLRVDKKTISEAARAMGRKGGRKQSAAQRAQTKSIAAAAQSLRVPCVSGSDRHRYVKGTCARCGITAAESVKKYREAQKKLKAKWGDR